MQVPFRARDAPMTQKGLDDAEIVALFQQHRRVGVAKGVGRGAFGESGLPHRGFEDLASLIEIQRTPPLAGKQPRRYGTNLPPVDPQGIQQAGVEGHDAFETALAQHPDDTQFSVEIPDLHPAGLAGAQASGKHGAE